MIVAGRFRCHKRLSRMCSNLQLLLGSRDNPEKMEKSGISASGKKWHFSKETKNASGKKMRAIWKDAAGLQQSKVRIAKRGPWFVKVEVRFVLIRPTIKSDSSHCYE